ncbi:MAG: Histone H2A.Z-specific chaperone [Bogoriella megaspora]|nr:MAG: Histone H2A.Z-specific chaperone [Bogoriella megaspora]
MAEENGTTIPPASETASAPTDTGKPGEQTTDLKGKGKAIAPVEDVSMDEDDEDESEEDEEQAAEVDPEDDDDEDDLQEIELDNIVADGRRTRGKAIDFAKANAEMENEDDEEDEDEDDDFVDPDGDDEMKD